MYTSWKTIIITKYKARRDCQKQKQKIYINYIFFYFVGQSLQLFGKCTDNHCKLDEKLEPPAA